MTNPRTESARAHDDKAQIEAAQDAPGTVLRSGGNLQRMVGTEDEERAVTEPERSTGVDKADAIATGEAYPSGKTGG